MTTILQCGQCKTILGENESGELLCKFATESLLFESKKAVCAGCDTQVGVLSAEGECFFSAEKIARYKVRSTMTDFKKRVHVINAGGGNDAEFATKAELQALKRTFQREFTDVKETILALFETRRI